MKKDRKLNTWLWKWHYIGGVISLPFVLILALTGGIYLFKPNYEDHPLKKIKHVDITETRLSFENLKQIADNEAIKKPNSMIIPKSDAEATEFISGRFGSKSSLYIDPYTGAIKGEVIVSKTDMFKIRKLHGELLMGKIGTKIVELVASWMVVLLLTGLYIFWPPKGHLKRIIAPRIDQGKRIFFRDLHGILGFWFSGVLILILAGGFPWTDVFGTSFKKIQEITHTGYPPEWTGKGIQSTPKDTQISLDNVVHIAKKLELKGEVTLEFPKDKSGFYSISNRNPQDLSSQQKIIIDSYSGSIIKHSQWSDVGVLMRARMWLMAFHQGEFGLWNFILILITAIGLTFMSISALISLILKKRNTKFGIPKVPANFRLNYIILTLIIILGLILPLFGLSLMIIMIVTFSRGLNNSYISKP